jgi:hypothetical protein
MHLGSVRDEAPSLELLIGSNAPGVTGLDKAYTTRYASMIYVRNTRFVSALVQRKSGMIKYDTFYLIAHQQKYAVLNHCRRLMAAVAGQCATEAENASSILHWACKVYRP